MPVELLYFVPSLFIVVRVARGMYVGLTPQRHVCGLDPPAACMWAWPPSGMYEGLTPQRHVCGLHPPAACMWASLPSGMYVGFTPQRHVCGLHPPAACMWASPPSPDPRVGPDGEGGAQDGTLRGGGGGQCFGPSPDCLEGILEPGCTSVPHSFWSLAERPYLTLPGAWLYVRTSLFICWHSGGHSSFGGRPPPTFILLFGSMPWMDWQSLDPVGSCVGFGSSRILRGPDLLSRAVHGRLSLAYKPEGGGVTSTSF